MAFVYTTRGNSSPQGKPRVCFLSLKEDHEKWFEELTGEVLELQNCAIWYEENGDTSAIDLSELDQMQLIVIPVTAKLLSTGNEVMGRCLPYAVEKNIPVLPVMMEPGLDAPFAEKWGDLEYLDKTAIDPTAIPYKERLNRYLSSILLDDNQIEEIRSAFDAYIFLSYRKKDRAYANELMRLIHQNEFSERVAIWYDEFLVPGESFNDAIEAAIKKSSLFSLVVTPNLVNEKNYVMDIEYPMAQKNNKNILPFEMVQTKIDELKKYYTDIPNPVDPQNREQIAQKLKDYLPVGSGPSGDPVHNFFVGLAYLSGIDVEVDRNRALKLIRSAAEANLDMAMKKLVSMYSKGDGVEKDVAKAVEWQEKVVRTYGDIAEETRSEDDAIVFLRESMDWADLAYSIEDYEHAERACSDSYEVAKVLSFGTIEKSAFGKVKTLFKKYVKNQSHFQESFAYMCRACRLMLDIAFEEGILDKINEWSKKADVLRNVAPQMNNPDISKELLRVAGRMAKECCESGNLSGARIWLGSAIDCYESLGEDEQTTAMKFNYSFLMEAASDMCLAVEEYKDAYACLEDRKDLLQPLQEEFPDNLQIRYEIIRSWLGQANIAYLYGDRKETAACTGKAKELIDAEVVDTDEVKLLQARYDLLMGSDAAAGQDYDQAISLLKESVAIITPLLDRLFDADHMREIATAEERLGDCYYDLKQYEEAYAWHLKAEKHVADVGAFAKSVRDTRTLAHLFEDLLYDAGNMGDVLKANEWNTKALWARKALATGVELARRGIRSAKNIGDLAEKGKIESPQFAKDKKDYERLLARQDDFREFLEHGFIPLENSLIVYVQSEEGQSVGTQQSGFYPAAADLIASFLDTHTVIDIRMDLESLKRLLLSGNDPDRVVQLANKVRRYILQDLEPFFRFDEKAMLLLSFCDYICKASEFLRDYPDIVFWKYPLEDIQYKELWAMLYCRR